MIRNFFSTPNVIGKLMIVYSSPVVLSTLVRLMGLL